MASDNEASCIADPNFAVICAFLQKFGTLCGLNSIDFIDLQKMMEDTEAVPEPLVNLHIKLLRRIKKAVSLERWERVLSKVCHTYNNQDGWEIERFGYNKSRLSCKLRTLKTLLEMQFDYHTKFKSEINKLTADQLRSQPLGKDKLGHAYWCQIDDDCQIRVYKEDPDEETWMLVAKDRDGLVSLISQLKENDSAITEVESVLNEDSNSLEIEKPILDTGQADSTSSLSIPADSKSDDNAEDDEKQDSKPIEEIKTNETVSTNGKKEGIEETIQEPPKQICLRLKPMSELLNSPSAAQYKAEEDAKRKRNQDEAVEITKPSKVRKLTLMNSKPVKVLYNKKHVEEFSEDEEDDDDEEEDMDEDSDEVSEEIEEPVMYVKGRGRGKDNCAGNIPQNSEETSPIIGEEICENVLFIFGEGDGAECETGNENQNQTNDKPQAEQSKKSIKLGTVMDSKTGKVPETTTKTSIKKNRWDVGKPSSEETIETPKVSMFFFGPNTNTTAGISFFGSTSNPSKASKIQSNTVANVDDYALSGNSIDNSNEGNTNAVKYKELSPEQNHKIEEIPILSTIEENVAFEDKIDGSPVTIENEISEVMPEDLTNYATRNNKLENFGDESIMDKVIDTPSSSINNENLGLLKNNEIVAVVTSSIENTATEELAKEKENSIISEMENNIHPKEEINVISENNGKGNDQSKLETFVLKLTTEKGAICSLTCDISKEETVEKMTPIIIDCTSTSSNILDDAKKDTDNMIVSGVTGVDVCVHTELDTSVTNIENTKESTIDSNTIITEMEIEEAADVADSNIENRSTESMEIEEIEKEEIDINKSGDSMEIEEIDKTDSSELNLGKLIEEAKRTHSFIDTTLPKKDKMLETCVSIDTLPADISTVDDSKISMDIEENSESTITTRNTTSESSVISEVTGKITKEAEISESNTKEVVEITRKTEYIGKNTEDRHKIDTVNDRHFPIEEIKFSDSTDRKLSVGNPATNKTEVNHHVPEDVEIQAKGQSDRTYSTLNEREKNKISSDVFEQSANKLISVESCVVPVSETVLKNIEPPAIIVTATTVATDHLSLAKEPECIKKVMAPLTGTEKSALDKTMDSVEGSLALADASNICVAKDQECAKKNLVPSTDADGTKTLDKPLDDKKAASPSIQSIESLESIDADRPASSIDRDSEVDTAEDPFDNVGITQDDPLGLAEEEQEDEIDEAEEEEVEEEEEEGEEGEIDPEDMEDEEVEGEDDELDEEEIEDEEVENEEDEEEEKISNPDVKGDKKIITPTKTVGKVVADKKVTLSSFSMDFNDNSDSLHLPPMIKEQLKKRQMMQLKKQAGGDESDKDDEELSEEEEDADEEADADEENSSDDSDDEEEEEELPPAKPTPKGNTLSLKQIRPPIKGNVKVPILPKVQRPPVPVQVVKSTTADLRKERKKKKSEIEILTEEIKVTEAPILGVRQSRRIAQIKIREEADKVKLEDLTLAQVKFESRKMFESAEKIKKTKLSSDDEYVASLDDLKKTRKKRKHKHPKFDEFNPWKSSSGSSSSLEEEQEEEVVEDSDHHDLKSDHEFSPESDLEDETEVKLVKRARTVRKEDKLDEDEEEPDDTPCEKCGKFDHPEWILLCDGCDHGWHCSCLRPALLVIPEGDWFCPPCQHVALLKKLEEQLVDLDKRRSKHEIEVRRKQRLAYVGISLNNVLATNDDKNANRKSDSSSSGSSGSTDSSDSDEPIYQLRQRRQTHSYRFNDYDDLINSAIQDEEEPVEDEEASSVPGGNQGRGKDIATIVNAEKEQRQKEGETVSTNKSPSQKVVKRKKKRKLNSLVVSSGEDGSSDEDFRGSSTDEDEDDFDEALSSDDSSMLGRKRKKGRRATRRSTRARRSRMDIDFINDDSDASDFPEKPKMTRRRARWTDDSDDLEEEDELSGLSDRSWNKKRKSGRRSSSKSRTKKSKRNTRKLESDSDEPVQKKKRKIKFGGLNDSDEEEERKPNKQDSARKTRGKKITYVDALGSDSEDEIRRRKAGVIEESEEEYVAEDEDGLEDEDGNEIEKDSDDSVSGVPAKVPIKPVAKKGKGKGGIKRIKRAQGIEDELFPPLKQDESKEVSIPVTVTPATTTTTTEVTTSTIKENTEPITAKEVIDKPEAEATDPMQEINRNIECMDEKLMMEDPDYATKQLQMVAAQLDRKKKEDALSAAEAAAASEDMAMHRRGRKPKVIPYMSPVPQILQAKIQDEDVQLENSNSPEPPVSLSAFGELATTPDDTSPAKKRRGRGKGKKTLEKEAAAAAALAAAATALGKEDLGAPPNQDDVLPMPKTPVKTARTTSPIIDPVAMATAKLAIATPPQPFSQTEPAPSVITRMLQSPQSGSGSGTPPGGSSPAGTVPVGLPYGSGPGPPPHKYYAPGPPPPLIEGRPPPPGLRGGPHLPPGIPPHAMGGPPGSPYGPLLPPPPMGGPMNHRSYQHGHTGPSVPPPGSALPPHMLRPPAVSHSPPMPTGALYHHHHTVDASPSGGSAIQPMGGGSPGRIPPPVSVGPHHPRTTVAPPAGVVVPPPTSVPLHLSSVPPDRQSPLGHTPPPPLIPPPGVGVGPRYPPHSPGHQPAPPRHHLHMVPPQHAMQHGMHAMAPRPPPPSAYPPGPPPPGSYYSTYSPQPSSGIPPEDYHHHHHPPLPPPHGYGLPPAATQPQPDSIIPPGPPSSNAVEARVGGLKPTHLHGTGVTDDSPQEAAVGADGQDSTGEFGGLVSYFSSQREDDLDG